MAYEKNGPRIFSIDDGKAEKAQKYGWLNAIHYMAPASLAGVGNLCPYATPGCLALCLGEHSGQAGIVKKGEEYTGINNTRASRRAKAVLFMKDRANYVSRIASEIAKASRKASRLGLKLCIRLNGSTDIAWEGIAVTWQGAKFRNLMTAGPGVQFLDYTKNAARMAKARPVNYYLILSRSETNEAECAAVLRNGHGNVAIVSETIPATWQGFPVVSGDDHDLRHLDPAGHVVALSPKGRQAAKDITGFVIRG